MNIWTRALQLTVNSTKFTVGDSREEHPVTTHITPNKRYVSCDPHNTTTIIVREYPGGDRVKVADPRGKHVRWISAKQIRPSALKPNGERCKSGYAPA